MAKYLGTSLLVDFPHVQGTAAVGQGGTGNTTNLAATSNALVSGSGSGNVIVSAATAPTAGQVLTATSGTAANWQSPSAGSDATTAAKGIIQLAGDLAGTAAAPTVPGLASKANLASPTFTGTPAGPTPATADNSTTIATTAFVKAQGYTTGAGYAPIASPTFTGTPAAPTPATADSSTTIATTAFVKAQAYAPLASPALTGVPTAPTAAANTNTTQVATTAYVVARTPQITVGTTAPASPAVGDIWIDTN